jgi:PQQ system protein
MIPCEGLGKRREGIQACSVHENRGLHPIYLRYFAKSWETGKGGKLVARAREKQLSEVVSELGLDHQNKATIGRLLNHGDLGHVEEKSDGTMTATIRITEDELTYSPSILVMPHGGELEIEFLNDDKNTHCTIVPSNGDYQWIWLVNHSRGKMTVNLDGPGYYWYSSNVGNDEGRGLMGTIVVLGDVPDEAKLDRPPQPRP